jgi:hypothetical protein
MSVSYQHVMPVTKEKSGRPMSGDEWLQLRTLLCGVVWALGPPQDEALAFVRR